MEYMIKIKPILKTATASFGITALNELQQLYNKRSLVEDGEFAIRTLEHINDKVNQFKAEDGKLLCHIRYTCRVAFADFRLHNSERSTA